MDIKEAKVGPEFRAVREDLGIGRGRAAKAVKCSQQTLFNLETEKSEMTDQWISRLRDGYSRLAKKGGGKGPKKGRPRSFGTDHGRIAINTEDVNLLKNAVVYLAIESCMQRFHIS